MSTVLITVVFSRFKLRPSLSLLFFTHFICSVMSSLLSTSRLLTSLFVMVFILHVTLPIPPTILLTPSTCVICSLFRLNRPADNIQTCLTPFRIGNHSVVPLKSCNLSSYSVCRSQISTVKYLVIPSPLMLFHIFKCCALSKSFV